MEIRPVKIRDIEKVRELELSCIREYFAETLENKWEDLPQEWKDNLGASSRNHFKAYLDSGLSLVAEEDGEIVGFIFAQMLHHIADEDNLLWIENMGVHPYFPGTWSDTSSSESASGSVASRVPVWPMR